MLSILIFVSYGALSQTKVSAEYGRAHFAYQHEDYGNGLRNQNESNYNFIAGFTIRKSKSNKTFWETGLNFTTYQQYYSTVKYQPAFASTFSSVLLPIRFGVENFPKKIGYEASVGVTIGFMESYKATYDEILVYPIYDSMSRGTINRDYTFIFPLLESAVAVSYKLSKKFSLYLRPSLSAGLIKITEYDIYYNIGSGMNDQRARQWGKGSFISYVLGIRRGF